MLARPEAAYALPVELDDAKAEEPLVQHDDLYQSSIDCKGKIKNKSKFFEPSGERKFIIYETGISNSIINKSVLF